MFRKRSFFLPLVPLLAFTLLVAACGGTASTNYYTTPTATTSSAQDATPTTASGSGAAVQTASATVNGKSVTILINAKGLTLYYRTSDTADSVCSGGCAQIWHPLLFGGSGAPASAAALPGTLSVLNDANGAQVTYQGHPLYNFGSDTAPGQMGGQGVAGIWFVATTDLKAAGGGSGNPTPTPTSSGYNGY